MMWIDRPTVVASRDGVVFGSLRCVEAAFGDGVVDLVLSGVPAIEVESWAWLTHPTVHPVSIALDEALWVQVRSGQSVWCCRGVVVGIVQCDLVNLLPWFVLSVAIALGDDLGRLVSCAGDPAGVLRPGG
jgi:hypothetical protein